MTTEFFINTGVRFGINPYLDEHAKAVPAVGGGLVMVIPYTCDNVPEGYKPFMSVNNIIDNPEKLAIFEGHTDIIYRKINPGSKVRSKYMYFVK